MQPDMKCIPQGHVSFECSTPTCAVSKAVDAVGGIATAAVPLGADFGRKVIPTCGSSLNTFLVPHSEQEASCSHCVTCLPLPWLGIVYVSDTIVYLGSQLRRCTSC